METQTFSTKPLLRPRQVEQAKSEIKTLEAQLESPLIEDKAEVYVKLNRVKKTFDEQVPRPPQNVDEEGRMVAREKQLLSEILEGMPSQEEMRKAPPGAVDKHMAWEKRNKPKILEWKNLRLRLNPGEQEAANFERHRPVTSTLSMDNAVVPGRQFFMPPIGSGLPVTFSDEQIEALRFLSPQLAGALAIMSRDQRQQVKDAIQGQGIGLAAPEPSIARVSGMLGGTISGERKRKAKRTKSGKERKPLSEEHKQALRDRLARLRAEKAAKTNVKV